MASRWCVRPDEVKLDLVFQDGEQAVEFWIKVKKDLTVGESRRVQTAGWRGVTGMTGAARRGVEPSNPEILIDWKAQTFARTAAYLTDWSLSDDNGNKLPISVAQLEALREDVFETIEQAVAAHVDAREQEKKARSGSSGPSTTSA